MSTWRVISTVFGIAAVVFIVMAPNYKSTSQRIADDNANEAAVLAAARDAAAKLDGVKGNPSIADVEAALPSGFQVTGGGGSRMGDLGADGGMSSTHTIEVSGADGVHHACLTVETRFSNFQYAPASVRADPGAC
ncbi:hypothetical protein [Nonomuraea soli]|uniref:Uncharacterized protein n=1 Tax=Nonomuraea soli TaxID=1032476 RepID=A0A7W0HQ79_9ACTN|nr:hypothetical protein [Nonomuraea soli]MBA2891639.1 hypothetical protein [Nonomuraea soli]